MIIAGHITATTVNLVCVQDSNGKPKLYNPATYLIKDFSNFHQILKLYSKKITKDINYACFGVAGPVINNEVKATNLLWQISASNLEKEFEIGRVKLFNDLVTTAHGLFELSSDKFIQINEGSKGQESHIGLIAAGDGLGQSLIYRDEQNYYPYASEGGHADFAPTVQFEVDLWEYLYSISGQVEMEDVLSFRGINNIFQFLLFSRKLDEPQWYRDASDKPQKIIEMCLSGQDVLAGETVEIFSDCFASEAANLALKGMTLGGIYIGGLIMKQIITSIDKNRFMERFVKKGKMASLLKNIPVNIILDDQTALIGAASYALKKSRL